MDISYKLEDYLSEERKRHVITQWLTDRNINTNNGNWTLLNYHLKPLSDGLTGFLGVHLKVALNIKIEDIIHTVKLFIKALPHHNKTRANFIDESNFYRREMMMYSIFNELKESEGEEPWHPKAYVCDESIVVMPDLIYDGYKQLPTLQYLNFEHVTKTLISVARFHASVAVYENNKKSKDGSYSIQNMYGNVLEECNFKDTPWLRTAARLMADFLQEFSVKYGWAKTLEEKITQKFLEACYSVKEYSNTLNVIIHKDLWINNIMFKYDGSKLKSAMLIDFQCLRYAPPAFDIMVFLYLNTTAEFREHYETKLYEIYFYHFEKSLDLQTQKKLKEMGYSFGEFCQWCDIARMFGMVQAIAINPYIFMIPSVAQKVFDDPETFDRITNYDRKEPVIAHAMEFPDYRNRILEMCEEFFEKYVQNSKD